MLWILHRVIFKISKSHKVTKDYTIHETIHRVITLYFLSFFFALCEPLSCSSSVKDIGWSLFDPGPVNGFGFLNQFILILSLDLLLNGFTSFPLFFVGLVGLFSSSAT